MSVAVIAVITKCCRLLEYHLTLRRYQVHPSKWKLWIVLVLLSKNFTPTIITPLLLANHLKHGKQIRLYRYAYYSLIVFCYKICAKNWCFVLFTIYFVFSSLYILNCIMFFCSSTK